MLLGLLLTLNIMICVALIAVVLLQRSEGGAFGSGSPTGLITTRGAGDLLTRTTWVLFVLFLAISLSLTLLGGRERSSQAILNRLKNVRVNPDLLAKPTAPPVANSAAIPPPVTAPAAAAATPPTAAPRPPKSAAAAGFSAPRPTVRVPASEPPAEQAPPAEAPTPAAPKLLTPTPPPLQIPPPPSAEGQAPAKPGPQ